MFYLTKEKIMDSKKTILHFRDFQGKKYLSIDNVHFLEIIKISDNILDFIEINDLIGFDENQLIAIVLDKSDNHQLIFTQGNVHTKDDIQSIYKPDSNGNYILVWKR